MVPLPREIRGVEGVVRPNGDPKIAHGTFRLGGAGVKLAASRVASRSGLLAPWRKTSIGFTLSRYPIARSTNCPSLAHELGPGGQKGEDGLVRLGEG